MSLAGKHITVGLTGGIACYKTASLIRLLVKAGCDVRAIMTEAATKFITPLTMETVTQNPVAVEMFPVDSFVATRHIDFADWADMMVIAPATANFLGKIASGISDDLLTTVVCATSKPILICPAMNPNMWNNPVTRRNCKELSDLGYLFEGPVEGEMACDHVGVGRLAEPETILAAIEAYLESTPKKKELVGKHIVVTAGPCREAIDPVRFISNRSSGRMGYALAEAAIKMGAQVTLISGPSALSAPVGAEYVPVESTEQMCHAVEDSMSAADCLIMAAAPADFRPAEPATNKIKKSGSAMDLRLMPTVDILQQVTR
ncbi:MAG: bifunctional phosphopantothenoylcysteine decarboxylase/phosphopantothenate--cysteine ligase CoaBC, partial [Candidatus Zixiibacteriota bacterium]